jgi:hypothetical protein
MAFPLRPSATIGEGGEGDAGQTPPRAVGSASCADANGDRPWQHDAIHVLVLQAVAPTVFPQLWHPPLACEKRSYRKPEPAGAGQGRAGQGRAGQGRAGGMPGSTRQDKADRRIASRLRICSNTHLDEQGLTAPPDIARTVGLLATEAPRPSNRKP